MNLLIDGDRSRVYQPEVHTYQPGVHVYRLGVIALAGLLLSACATRAPSNSMAVAEQHFHQTYPGFSLPDSFSSESSSPDSSLAGFAPGTATQADTPLTLQGAIQLFLHHSPQVRLALAELGIADAQRLQAELISNPHLSLGALRPEGGGRWQVDVGLSQPLLAFFTRSLRQQAADEALLGTQWQLQRKLQRLISEVSHTYMAAVTAQQHLDVHQQVLEAGKAQQQLAQALYDAGNVSEHNFLYYDNELRKLQRAINDYALTAHNKRLELTALLGLASTQRLLLPAHLPLSPPKETFDHSVLWQRALEQRLDIQLLDQQLKLLHTRRSLVRNSKGWRDLSVGINAEREFDGSRNLGPELEFALPLFNQGQGKVAVLTAQAAQLQAQAQILKQDIDKDIASLIHQLRVAQQQRDLVAQALVVAKKRTVLANREVNFMLSSPFELIATKQEEIQLAHAQVKELHNYWQARVALDLAVGQHTFTYAEWIAHEEVAP